MTDSDAEKVGASTGRETKFRLTTALLRHGQVKLSEELGISATELSKKINGENGWKLEQIAAALDFVGAQVIPGDEDIVIIPRKEWLALRLLVRQSMEQDD